MKIQLLTTMLVVGLTCAIDLRLFAAPQYLAPTPESAISEELGALLLEPAEQPDRGMGQVIAPMQVAESQLRSPTNRGGASAAQTDAIAGLDIKIAELAERQSRCCGSKCKSATSSRSGKKSGDSGKAGSSAAKSTSSVRSVDAPFETATAATADLIRDLWGHLPQRQRDQILQPLSEEFLPKYAPEIESYFRALADPRNQETAPR